MAGTLRGGGSNQSAYPQLPLAIPVIGNRAFAPRYGVIQSPWPTPQTTVSGVGFAGPPSAIDFRSGTALPPGFTLTRSTVGAYIDSTGTRQFAPIDTPRFLYRTLDGGQTWVNAGLLNSRSATNYALSSENLSTGSVWLANGVITSTGDVLGADGSTPMTRGTSSNSFSNSQWNYQQLTGLGNSFRSVAVDLKYGTWRYQQVRVTSDTNVTATCIVDLQTNTITETFVNNASFVDGPYIEQMREGIIRVGFTVSCATTSTTTYFMPYGFVAQGSGLVYAANGDINSPARTYLGEYVYADCAFISDGPGRPRHIPTTTTAVTSGADFLSATAAGMGVDLSSSVGFSAMLEAEADHNASAEFFDAQDSSTVLAEMQRGTGAADYVTKDVGGSSTSSATYTSSLAHKDRFRWAATFSNTKTSESINGDTATTATQTSNLPADPTTFYIGNKSGSTNVVDTVFTKFALFDNQLADADLATLSALDGPVVVSGAHLATGTTAVGTTGANVVAGAGAASGSATVSGVGAATANSTAAAAGASTVTAVGASTARSVGAASGTSTVSGVGAATANSTAAAASTSTVTGVGRAIANSTAAAAGTSTVTATGAATANSTAAAAGTSTVTATGAATANSTAAAAGTSTVTAVGASTAASTVAAAGTSTVTAVGLAVVTATAAAAGTSTVTGVGRAIANSTAAAAGTSTVTATGASTAASTAAAAGTSTVTATGAATANSIASATGTGSATAVGASTAVATGSAAGSGVATAVGIGGVKGAATGAGTALAVGASTFAAVGSSAGASTVTAVGASTVAAVGASAGAGTAAGVGRSTANSVGASSGIGTASAFSGTFAAASGVATVSGVGRATAAAVGTAAGTSSVAALSVTVLAAVGSSAGAASVTAAGAAVIPAVGSAAGAATTTAIGVGVAGAVGSSAGSATVSGIGSIAGAVINAVGSAAGVGVASAIGASIYGVTTTSILRSTRRVIVPRADRDTTAPSRTRKVA